MYLPAPLYLASSFDIRWLEPAVNPDGTELLPGTDIYFNNPYFVAYKFENSTSRNRLTGALTLKYNFTDWLSLQAQVTRDGYIFDLRNVVPTGTGYQPGGSITQTTTDYHEVNANYLLDFNKAFGDFTVHANAGGNLQDDIATTSGVYGAGPFNVPYFYDVSNTSSRPLDYSYSHYRVNSLYGSADLGYKNFLFLSGTARNDWFSTLNPETNSYLYPSVSSSFVFSDAFKLPEFISFGKLRASYAYSSNGTSPYRNLLTYGLQGYTLGDQPLGYINQSEIPNSQLKPVKISEQEIGLNMDFFQNRLGFDVAFYNKKTTDDILGVTISPTSGYNGNVVNIGEIRNKGIEVLLRGTPIRTRDFSWLSSFNIAFNNNKVLKLAPPNNDPVVIDGAFPRWGDGVSLKNIVGLPFSQIVGYAYKRMKMEIRYLAKMGFPSVQILFLWVQACIKQPVASVTNSSTKAFHCHSFLTLNTALNYFLKPTCCCTTTDYIKPHLRAGMVV
jgi:outer membrane receptor protein involved in Fe transport